MERHLSCKQEIGVRLPGGPLAVTERRKVAGYGWPGRTANAVSPRGMKVRIPCLPLRTYGVPVVERRSRLGPNEEFRVRFLAGTCSWRRRDATRSKGRATRSETGPAWKAGER